MRRIDVVGTIHNKFYSLQILSSENPKEFFGREVIAIHHSNEKVIVKIEILFLFLKDIAIVI